MTHTEYSPPVRVDSIAGESFASQADRLAFGAAADFAQPLPKGLYGHLHNVYLQYAAERGLPSLACMLWIIGKMARNFRAALKTPARSGARFIWVGALAVIAAILAEGFFEYNRGGQRSAHMFLATTTCGYVALGCE
jgi:putative inorganic carbon (HCO3(-)) transporter